MSRRRAGRDDTVGSIVMVAVLLGAWCVVVSGPHLLSSGMTIALVGAARSLAAGLFLVAGAARLACWRLTGDHGTGYSAIVLLVVGAAIPTAGVVDAQLKLTSVTTTEVAQARLTLLLPAFGVIVVGALSHRRLTPRRFVYLLTGFVAATLAVGGFVVVLARNAALGDAWIGLELAAAGAWLVIAFHLRPSTERPAGMPRVILAAGLMAGCELFKAWTAADAGAPRGIATGLQLAAAALVLMTSVSELVAAARTENRQSIAALQQAQQRLVRAEQRERARLHDARSVVLGVRGASELLVEASLPGLDRTKLRQLVAAELDRLGSVLDGDTAGPARSFVLADVLRPVVLRHRLDGMVVRTDLGAISACGQPAALATVIDNLLTNAGVHAPGAWVDVAARVLGPLVVITVDDDGPGIPSDERARLLRPGARGSTARGPGSGLGLYSAACSMADQNGTVHLTPRPGGGTRVVLTLPVSAPAAVPAS